MSDDSDVVESGDPDIIDLGQLASILRVTEKAIRGWIAAGMPVLVHGTQGGARNKTMLSFRAAVEWYFSENYERLELDRQRTRLASEQADERALENAVTRGELLDASLIGDGIERALVAFQARMRGLATKLAPRVNPEKPNLARDIIATEIDAALHSLADNFSQPARGKLARDDDGSDRSAPAAGKVNGQRMGGSISKAKPGNKRRAGGLGH